VLSAPGLGFAAATLCLIGGASGWFAFEAGLLATDFALFLVAFLPRAEQ
jgi:hypothetical protein